MPSCVFLTFHLPARVQEVSYEPRHRVYTPAERGMQAREGRSSRVKVGERLDAVLRARVGQLCARVTEEGCGRTTFQVTILMVGVPSLEQVGGR